MANDEDDYFYGSDEPDAQLGRHSRPVGPDRQRVSPPNWGDPSVQQSQQGRPVPPQQRSQPRSQQPSLAARSMRRKTQQSRQQPPDANPNRVYTDDNVDYDRLVTESLLPEPTMLKRVASNRRFRIAGFVAITLVILLTVGIFVKRQVDPGGVQGSEVTLKVPQGASFATVATKLSQQGVVPSVFGMKLWAKVSGAPAIQTGEYTFRKNSSASQAFAVLEKGPKQQQDKLVIPEGRRVSEVAELVGKLPGMSADKFNAVVASGTIRSQFQPAGKSLEGFLFPDTYFISSSDNETTLLQRMVNQFDNKARFFQLEAAQKSIARSPYEALIIASLIESEAKMSHDRAKVSQVVENRLTQKMPLQFDSTVLYGLKKRGGLTTAELKIPGPYNSYTNRGLPPTPISNPGEASLRAALAPEPGPWLYFVVIKTDGTTAFATTNTEHEANKRIAVQNGVQL